MTDALHLRDLTPDPKNARRHTPRNVGTIVDALHEVGAGRSIVIDEHNVVLAGNATIEAAAEAGIENVLVVETDGHTLVAVRRTDLTPAQKTRLALFDNRASDLAEWDGGVLRALQESGVTMERVFTEGELRALIARDDVDDAPTATVTPDEPVPTFKCPRCGLEWTGAATGETAATSGSGDDFS